jgi:hypothetical protein
MTGDLDKDLLHEIGFATQGELKTFLEKLNIFFDTLTAAEKKAFRATMTDAVDAARTFKRKVTAEELTAFIRSKGPDTAEMTICIHSTVVRRKKDDEGE